MLGTLGVLGDEEGIGIKREEDKVATPPGVLKLGLALAPAAPLGLWLGVALELGLALWLGLALELTPAAPLELRL